MICADFESILVPEDNGKQNTNESYTSKYQKHVACSYGYKLVCVDDTSVKSCLGENAVYNVINSMVEEDKFFSDVMKKHFNKELAMTRKDGEDFKNSTECWICDNSYVDGDVKVRDDCHVTGKHC